MFLAADTVQVAYEMLRAHLVDGLPVTEAAAGHGCSRAVLPSVVGVSVGVRAVGMAGLFDELQTTLASLAEQRTTVARGTA